jgi:hypothetical protein
VAKGLEGKRPFTLLLFSRGVGFGGKRPFTSSLISGNCKSGCRLDEAAQSWGRLIGQVVRWEKKLVGGNGRFVPLPLAKWVQGFGKTAWLRRRFRTLSGRLVVEVVGNSVGVGWVTAVWQKQNDGRETPQAVVGFAEWRDVGWERPFVMAKSGGWETAVFR